MANTKMTKVRYFAEVAQVVEASKIITDEFKADLLGFISHEVELLNKKSSKSTETSAQRSSAAIAITVKEVLADIGKPVTVTELMEDDKLQTYIEEAKGGNKTVKMTNQKLASVLNKLYEAKEVSKTYEKKKAYFSLPEAEEVEKDDDSQYLDREVTV